VRLRQAVGQRNHYQRPAPEVFVLVVLHQPIADAAGLADIHAWHSDFRQLAQQKIQAHLLHLGHPHAVQVTVSANNCKWN